MALVVPISFSQNGQYLAHSGPDGTLKIWQTSTGNLKQQYTPTSHLSATCSCLTWGPLQALHRAHETPNKKRKLLRRSDVGGQANDEGCDLIAMGTTSGTLLLYSMVKGDLHTHLEGGHIDTVHGACWHPEENTLYSCSNDKYIVQWDLATAKVKHKWKGDQGGIYSVCLCHSKRHLLSASRKIKLWDLETRQVLKRFTGHGNEVHRLLSIPSRLTASPGGSGLEGAYCLSSAVADRFVSVWQLSPTAEDSTVLASFALPEEPVHMEVSSPSADSAVLVLSVVTKSGQLIMCEHILNGRCKTPLKPKHTVQVATEVDIPKPIPILCSKFINSKNNFTLCHGTFIKAVFETMSYKKLQPHECLLRPDPAATAIQEQSSVSTVKRPEVSKDMTVLAPGHSVPNKVAIATDGKTAPAKTRRNSKSTEMSMEERLQALSAVAQPSSGVPPRADTLATLLSQALQSQDKKILNSVLQEPNEMVIKNTVRKLPAPLVVPLVQELSKRMHGSAQSGILWVKWMKTLLSVHASYLMTYPELVDSLGSLYQMMTWRIGTFGRLSKLQGRLDLLLSQGSAQDKEGEEAEALAAHTAMLVYQDESSSEDEMQPEAHSDSDWDLVDDAAEDSNAEEDDMEHDGDDDQEDQDDDEDDSDDANDEDVEENGNSSSSDDT